MGSVSTWDILPQAMGKSVKGLQQALTDDPWWKSFVTTEAIIDPVTIGVKSAGDGDAILVKVEPGPKTTVTTGPSSKADFTLVAKGDQWEQFMAAEPKAPYTSFVGLQGMNIKQEGVGVEGDSVKHAQYAHLASTLLDKLREGTHGKMRSEQVTQSDEDFINSRYIYIYPPQWGRSKVFVETSGNGPQEVLFLHTAGADSRQYHGVMNDSRMRERFTMYAFDLPAHGRSFPYANYIPGAHVNNEETYIGSIREVIKVLKLNKPILSGASMAGQICILAALRADEVGISGSIPLQGTDYLIMDPRNWHDKSPTVNQTTFNPDWILHMQSPHAPIENRLLVWHTYSSQAYGIFHGDLDFYFAQDARDRVGQIDTKKCPVHFLTGEYDWSTTPQMVDETASRIPGSKAVAMKNLGHFPATESPNTFIPYFLDAVDWINKKRQS